MFYARSRIGRSIILAGCALQAVGCGSDHGYQLAPTSGVVTLDGEPLVAAVVNFQPMTSGDKVLGPGSVGRTDQSGRFELLTVQDDLGAWVGTHKVKIYSYSPETPSIEDTDSGPSQERVPHRYNYQSKLTFEVPEGGTDQANFDLQTNP